MGPSSTSSLHPLQLFYIFRNIQHTDKFLTALQMWVDYYQSTKGNGVLTYKVETYLQIWLDYYQTTKVQD